MLQYQIIPVTSFQQNCSLVWCDKTRDAVLIDPGGEVDKLQKAIAENEVNLTAIWLTHGHLDHVGATAELKKRLAIPVIGPHKEDEFLINALPKQCEMFGFALVENFMPDKWLIEGEKLTLGEEKFSVMYLPGHTPGHVVLKHDKQQLLWVGDVIFKHSIGRTDFPRGDHQQLLTSIKTKLLSLDDHFRFIPGHGPESTIGEERVNNPFLV
ncbi:MAG: hypothetical protein DIZ80_07175 [endosymbiont of Galathealinum brachiosum]|uniref:Metallo-beta-lactamase domain-containing protein n=1 Tax=endosymbiont of Galathealinum brachiosum TaxID=2200906 RepID=A0A370DGA1_9GAMM|nr:MAG: hypothetical protein DIZ80_07175 [endosymbiont of Galathealinum brachiosum]